MIAPTRRWPYLAAIAICITFALPVPGWLSPGGSAVASGGRELIFWLMTASIVTYVLCVERQSLASVGLRRPSFASLGFGVAAAFVSFTGMALIYLVILPHIDPSYATRVSTVQNLSLGFRAVIVIRAAVFEELFYRGFMIERLAPILRSRFAAATLSWAAFTAAHVAYWGPGSILLAGFGGAVLTALYLWRRDLVSNVLAHGLTDAISILL